MCYEIWKSQTFVILSFDYPVSQDFVEICTPFCFVFWDHFLRKLYILHFFCFVLGNNSYSFLGDVKTSCYCVKETIELTGKFTGLSLLHGTVFEFFLECLSLTWTCFRFLFQFLLSFGFSCKNLEVNFDFFPSNH